MAYRIQMRARKSGKAAIVRARAERGPWQGGWILAAQRDFRRNTQLFTSVWVGPTQSREFMESMRYPAWLRVFRA
jgi:hypothetical protein